MKVNFDHSFTRISGVVESLEGSDGIGLVSGKMNPVSLETTFTITKPDQVNEIKGKFLSPDLTIFLGEYYLLKSDDDLVPLDMKVTLEELKIE